MTKTDNQLSFVHKARAAVGVIVISGLVIGSSFVPAARADTFGDQIEELRRQNESNYSAVSNLADQATSYQHAINSLESSIVLLQGQIAVSVSQRQELEAKIIAGQQELDRQKVLLGDNLKVMYVNGQMSTVEMLASSNDLSTFVDAETYRGAIQNKIQLSLQQIYDLQNKLIEQKRQTELLLEEQRKQETQLAANRAEQNKLLALNQQQQEAYNENTKHNQAKINELIIQQRIANARRSRGNGPDFTGSSSYPYANANFSMRGPGCVDGDGPDKWGYCTRQCVSYAAWAVERSGRDAPLYYGDAANWVSAARRDNVPIYSVGQARAGDVAIDVTGRWGHAMYVEGVSGSDVYVSQYNAGLRGEFSTDTIDGSGLYFLRFP